MSQKVDEWNIMILFLFAWLAQFETWAYLFEHNKYGSF